MNDVQKLILEAAPLLNQKNFTVVDRKIYIFLKQFFVIQRKVDVFQQEVIGCNQFWSRYLSAFFAIIAVIVTFFAYFYVKTKADDSFIIVGFIFFFGFILVAMLLWITLECSVIGYNSLTILNLQTKFIFHLQMIMKLPKIVLLKV